MTSQSAPSREELAAAYESRVVVRAKGRVVWWKRSRFGRALTHYLQANGALLCGGIAYSALFSLVAGLTIGYTVFMDVLGGRDELKESLIESINSLIPGLLTTSDSPGLIDPDSLLLDSAVTPFSVISVVVLLVSATSCMGSIRSGVRVMFGMPRGSGIAFRTKVAELGGFVAVGLGVLLSAVVNVVTTNVGDWFVSLLHLQSAPRLLLPLVGIAVSFVIDMLVFVLVVVVLAGLRPDRGDLFVGGLVAATGFGIIRFLGTSVVSRGVESNALLASFAVIVTLLIWINLSARILLFAAAVTADLPLTLLVQERDEAVAQAAIKAARARENGHQVDFVVDEESRRFGRKLLGLAAALVWVYVLGSRRGGRREIRRRG